MQDNISFYKRLKKLILKITLICLVGLGYAFFVRIFNIAFFCPIYSLTGLYCPGCGISRMCMALMRFDFKEAIGYNIGVAVSIPFAAAVFIPQAVKYVKYGSVSMSKRQNILLYIIIAWLFVFAVLRNIPQFSFLAP